MVIFNLKDKAPQAGPIDDEATFTSWLFARGSTLKSPLTIYPVGPANRFIRTLTDHTNRFGFIAQAAAHRVTDYRTAP